MHVHAWIVLAGIILTMIVVDIVGHVRTPHEPTLKEATLVVRRLHRDRPHFRCHRLGGLGIPIRPEYQVTSPKKR